jgi:hypothetical protein
LFNKILLKGIDEMLMQELIEYLSKEQLGALEIALPDGEALPAHFHITEVGRVRKDFVDCGGTPRQTEACVLQAWVANDIDHRLTSHKLVKILELGSSLFPSKDVPVELEIDRGTVSLFSLQRVESTANSLTPMFRLVLSPKHTECLAPDRCGVGLQVLSTGSCAPGSGCC